MARTPRSSAPTTAKPAATETAQPVETVVETPAATEAPADEVVTEAPPSDPIETEASADEGAVDVEQSVAAELLAACIASEPKFAGPGPKESGTQFCARIMQQISAIPDDAFEVLSDGAKDWYNAFGEALNEGKATEEPEGLDVLMAAAAAPKAPKPAAAAAPKGPKPPAEPPKPKAPGVVATVRRLIVENSTSTLDDIRKMAEGLLGEIKDTTFSAIMTDTMATIKLAKELGRWKD